MKTSRYETFFAAFSAIVVIVIISFIAFSLNSSTSMLRSNTMDINSNNVVSSENTNTNTNLNTDTNPNANNAIDKNKDEKKEIIKSEEVILSTYSTNIYDNDKNRVDNIALAISKINGKTVEKDAIFSFNETVGPMDETHGFKESTVFDANGNVIKAPGGGMCQISSTMYNTALGANLEIVERHPHSRRVDYVPVDRDATIYYDTLDFKFKNTSGNVIKIIATSDEYNVTITFNQIIEKKVIE